MNLSKEIYSELLFGEQGDVIINKALDATHISTIDYKNDDEMERLTSVMVACNCIINGPFLVTADQLSVIENRLNKILDMIPNTTVMNDFPRAIQFRGVIEKIRDNMQETNPTMFISKMMEDNYKHRGDNLSDMKKKKIRRNSVPRNDLLFEAPVEFSLRDILTKGVEKDKRIERGNTQAESKKRLVYGGSQVSVLKPSFIITTPATIDIAGSDEPQKRRKKSTVRKQIDSLLNTQVDKDHSLDSQEGQLLPLEPISMIRVNEIYVPESDTVLRSLVCEYLKNMAGVSRTLYERDIKKAKQDRFIITGLHETLYYVRYDKVLFLCIAEDIISMNEDGYTNKCINTFVKECKKNNTVMLQCFTRRKLARFFKRGKQLSCICILKSQRAMTDAWKSLSSYIKSKPS